MLSERYPPIQIPVLRGGLSLPLIVLWIHGRGAWPEVMRARWPLHLLRGALVIAMLVLFTVGVRGLPLTPCRYPNVLCTAFDHGARWRHHRDQRLVSTAARAGASHRWASLMRCETGLRPEPARGAKRVVDAGHYIALRPGQE